MKREEDREYHTRRAQEEFDRAYRTNNSVAAAAHMRLSSLHMQRLAATGGQFEHKAEGKHSSAVPLLGKEH